MRHPLLHLIGNHYIERADKYEEESRKLRIELIERDKREKELNGKILELKNEIKLLS